MKNISLLVVSVLLFSTAYSQKWQKLASVDASDARHHPGNFAVDGKGYLLTGSNSAGLLNDFKMYDPIAGPEAIPIVPNIDKIPSASPRILAGTMSATYADVPVGLKPVLKPCNNRTAKNPGIVARTG